MMDRCGVVGSLLFFFFQAEDGIRDLTVTGVQTCALPISVKPGSASIFTNASRNVLRCSTGVPGGAAKGRSNSRSEERRVGKECRSRWSPYRQKKKETLRDAQRPLIVEHEMRDDWDEQL